MKTLLMMIFLWIACVSAAVNAAAEEPVAVQASDTAIKSENSQAVECKEKCEPMVDPKGVQRVVKEHRDEVQTCYTQEFEKDASLAGRVEFQFTIGVGGVVTAIEYKSTLNNQKVERCISDAIQTWVFPEPHGKWPAIIIYPFAFNSVELDRLYVRRVFRKHRENFDQCYANRPKSEGRRDHVVIQFTVAADGVVAAVGLGQNTFQDAEFEKCIKAETLKLVFPKDERAQSLIGSFTLEFGTSQRTELDDCCESLTK